MVSSISQRQPGVQPIKKVPQVNAPKLCPPGKHQMIQDRTEPGRQYCAKCGYTVGD